MERLILVTTYMVITTSVNMIQGSVFDMYDEDKIICKAYNVVIPANCEAKIILPRGTELIAGPGKHSFEECVA